MENSVDIGRCLVASRKERLVFFALLVCMLLAPGLGQAAAGVDWEWANPLPQGNVLHGVAGDGAGNFVGVGELGTIMVSPDGTNWTAQSSGTAEALRGVTWSGTQFVAVGAPSTILTSPDGVTWTAQVSGTTAWLTGVTWGGGQFVAVGSGGTILTSPDGITWTARTSDTTETLNHITWSGGQFVAVNESGTILTSPNGVTWTARNSGTGNSLNSVISSGTQFIAVGDWGTILRSVATTCTQSGYVPRVTVKPGANDSTIYLRTSSLASGYYIFTTQDTKLIKAAVKSLPGRTYVKIKGDADCTTATSGGAAQQVIVAP